MAQFSYREPLTDDEWSQYFQIRYRMLREPHDQPPGSERDALEDRSIHIAAVSDRAELIGVGRVCPDATKGARLNYLAVLDEWQGHGIGSRILEILEQKARESGVELLWLNSRDSAASFYTKRGYVDVGPGRTLFDIIPHRLMSKSLVER